MADLYGDREGSFTAPEIRYIDGSGNGRSETGMSHLTLPTGSARGEGKGSRRRTTIRPSMDADEFMNLLHGSDPVKLELNRLENEVRDKERELGDAQAEIKALKLSERLREKAVEEECYVQDKQEKEKRQMVKLKYIGKHSIRDLQKNIHEQ